MRSLWYDVMVTALAVGMVVCWRLGVRDGMRMRTGQAPEAVPVQKATPAGQPLPVAQEQDGDGGEKLREQLEEIDAYDGWKR